MTSTLFFVLSFFDVVNLCFHAFRKPELHFDCETPTQIKSFHVVMYTNTVFVFNFNSETFHIHLFCNCDNCLSFSSTINILILVFSNTIFMSALFVFFEVWMWDTCIVLVVHRFFFLIALIRIYSCARVPFQLCFDECGDFFFSFIKRKRSKKTQKNTTQQHGLKGSRGWVALVFSMLASLAWTPAFKCFMTSDENVFVALLCSFVEISFMLYVRHKHNSFTTKLYSRIK